MVAHAIFNGVVLIIVLSGVLDDEELGHVAGAAVARFPVI